MRRGRAYVRECVIVIVVAAVAMLLELADFPPIAWVLDAHSLWHLCTAPLPLPWYRLVTTLLYLFSYNQITINIINLLY